MAASDAIGGVLLSLLAFTLIAAVVGRCAGASDPSAPSSGSDEPPRTLTLAECLALPFLALRRMALLSRVFIRDFFVADTAAEVVEKDAPRLEAETDIESDGALLMSTPPPPVDTWGMHVKKKAPPPSNEKNTATSPLAPKSPKGSSARSRRNNGAAAAEEPPPPPPPPKDGLTPRGRTSSADRPPRGNTPKAAAGGAKKPPPPTRGLAKASSTSNKPGGVNRGQDTSPTGSVTSVSSNKSSFRDTAATRNRAANAREVVKPWEK